MQPSFSYAISVHQLDYATEHAFMFYGLVKESSNGQTLKHVGLCLMEPVFTHGQLYAAVSPVTDGANLRIIVPDTPEARREGKIKNVVYSEVFS